MMCGTLSKARLTYHSSVTLLFEYICLSLDNTHDHQQHMHHDTTSKKRAPPFLLCAIALPLGPTLVMLVLPQTRLAEPRI
ncbi:hypothetical protein P692DRAFT_20271851 [Suillus brevipes Sb2]|nr:hypothetical protein P692DRAFT_20271851 [Suillus brevipes Sb2]